MRARVCVVYVCSMCYVCWVCVCVPQCPDSPSLRDQEAWVLLPPVMAGSLVRRPELCGPEVSSWPGQEGGMEPMEKHGMRTPSQWGSQRPGISSMGLCLPITTQQPIRRCVAAAASLSQRRLSGELLQVRACCELSGAHRTTFSIFCYSE